VRATKQQLDSAFRGRSEFFEVLLRIKRDQPQRYQLNISAGTQRRVEIYESLKLKREGRTLT
jgi:ABC-type arginine transport system ATPase subunit